MKSHRSNRCILAVLALQLIGCAPETEVQEDDCRPPDIMDASYRIQGEQISFRDGRSSVSIEGLEGATTVTQWRVVQSTTGDLNRDGQPDHAVVLQADPGGSGTFYYVAATTRDSCDMAAVEGLYLGDRIRAESIEVMESGHVDAGMIIVGMGIFNADQTFSEEPALYLTKMFRVEGPRLVEISQY